MTVAVARPSRNLTSCRDTAGGRLFAKAPRTPAHREDLRNEAAVYAILRDRCPATAARVPRDAYWNPGADRLEMEAVPAANLAERVAACEALEPAVAAAIGTALGELHSECPDPGPGCPRSDWLAGGVGIARPTPARMRLLSAGGIELLKALQRSDGLQQGLRSLAPSAGDAIVHGDLRWQNVLVAPGQEPLVWLVDWEMGGTGERAWDTGCFAAACVSAWLCSIPSVPGLAPDRLAAEAALPLEALLHGLGAFWTAYRATAPTAHGDAWTERCTQLAAVRLVYMGFECTQFDVSLQPVPIAHLQVAAHMLGDPTRAGRELLGMP